MGIEEIREEDEGPPGKPCPQCGVYYGEHRADCPRLIREKQGKTLVEALRDLTIAVLDLSNSYPVDPASLRRTAAVALDALAKHDADDRWNSGTDFLLWKGEKSRPLSLRRPCGCGCDSRTGTKGVGYLTGSNDAGEGFTIWLRNETAYQMLKSVIGEG